MLHPVISLNDLKIEQYCAESGLQCIQDRRDKGDDGIPDRSDLRLNSCQCCADQDLDRLPDSLKQIFERIQCTL